MRLLLVFVIVLPIVVAAWFLSRGPWPEPESQRAARAAVDSLTWRRFAALERGEFEAWGHALSANVLILGADPARVTAGREASITGKREELAALLERKQAAALRPNHVMAGATRRGRLAWAVADLGAGTDSPGGGLRHSAAYVLQEGEWRVLLEHESRAWSWEALRDAAAAARLPAPTLMGSTSGRRSERLARRLERWLPNMGRMRFEHQAIVIGPGPGELALGDSAAKRMVEGWERRLGPLRLVGDERRAWVGSRGVGWVAAHLEASPPEWGGRTLPLRFTGVFRDSGEDSWRLVVGHLAAPDPASQPVASATQR